MMSGANILQRILFTYFGLPESFTESFTQSRRISLLLQRNKKKRMKALFLSCVSTLCVQMCASVCVHAGEIENRWRGNHVDLPSTQFMQLSMNLSTGSWQMVEESLLVNLITLCSSRIVIFVFMWLFCPALTILFTYFVFYSVQICQRIS